MSCARVLNLFSKQVEHELVVTWLIYKSLARSQPWLVLEARLVDERSSNASDIGRAELKHFKATTISWTF